MKKLKKTPRDIIILHKCTINDNHMIYGFWDINCNRQIFFMLGQPLTAQKMKFQNYDKNTWKYHHVTDIIVIFHFGLFFALLTPLSPPLHLNSPENENFKKIKKHLKKSSFYTSVTKIMIIYYNVPETWCITDIIVVFDFGQFFALLPP